MSAERAERQTTGKRAPARRQRENAAAAAPVVDRTPPHNLEAERAVLGAILIRPETLATVSAILDAGAFWRVAHQEIYRAAVRLEQAGTAIDPVTIREALTQAGKLEAVGGPAYVSSLADGVPRSTNVEHYAEIVAARYRRRAIIAAAESVIADAHDSDDEVDDVLARAEAGMSAIANGKRSSGYRKLADILGDVMTQIEEWHANRGSFSGVPSGLPDLDRELLGFKAGKLYVVGARPGMGKSSFAENVVRYAGEQGYASLTFSLEMDDEEYAFRALASAAGVNGQTVQRGQVGERDLGRISVAWQHLASLPVYINDDPYTTVEALRAEARRCLAREGRLDLVVLDYTQLMLSSTESGSRSIEVGNITRGLKTLAKELRIPVIALSQLNRKLEERTDKRPLLSDLRDSGSIEQDADVVLFIYREDKYKPDTKRKGIADLIIAKHRGGPEGTVETIWRPELTRFEHYEPYQGPRDQQLPTGDR